MEKVDPCSFLVNQMMYWPTCSSDGEYICKRYDGEPLDPDVFLSAYHDWKDPTTLLLHLSEKEQQNHQQKKQEDPLTKEGVVGTFCRAYSIEDAIHTFLSDVYEETAVPSRWTYIPGESAAGLVVYDDKFAYSHHATDPAGGMLLNAFDLVRVHLFGNDDSKQSMKDMLEFASNDERVRVLGLEERQKRAGEDFSEMDDEDDSWKSRLLHLSPIST